MKTLQTRKRKLRGTYLSLEMHSLMAPSPNPPLHRQNFTKPLRKVGLNLSIPVISPQVFRVAVHHLASSGLDLPPRGKMNPIQRATMATKRRTARTRRIGMRGSVRNLRGDLAAIMVTLGTILRVPMTIIEGRIAVNLADP
jgi:hypothetical protein